MQSVTIAIMVCSCGAYNIVSVIDELLGQEITEQIVIIKQIRAMIVIFIEMHDSKRSDSFCTGESRKVGQRR